MRLLLRFKIKVLRITQVHSGNAYVPEANLLGKVNEGYKIVMSGLDIEHAFYAVIGVGTIEETCISHSSMHRSGSSLVSLSPKCGKMAMLLSAKRRGRADASAMLRLEIEI